jgi:hypothetical protein
MYWLLPPLTPTDFCGRSMGSKSTCEERGARELPTLKIRRNRTCSLLDLRLISAVGWRGRHQHLLHLQGGAADEDSRYAGEEPAFALNRPRSHCAFNLVTIARFRMPLLVWSLKSLAHPARFLDARKPQIKTICFCPDLSPVPPARDATALEIRLEGRFLSRAKDEEGSSLRRGDLNATFNLLLDHPHLRLTGSFE